MPKLFFPPDRKVAQINIPLAIDGPVSGFIPAPEVRINLRQVVFGRIFR